MITNCKNWHSLLWLTSFLVTTGVWAYLESYALAQSGGTLTVNTGALVINPDNVGSISLRSPNSLSITSDGNLSVNAGSISLTPLDSVPSTNGGNISINAVPILLAPSNSVPGTSGGNIILEYRKSHYTSRA